MKLKINGEKTKIPCRALVNTLQNNTNGNTCRNEITQSGSTCFGVFLFCILVEHTE